MMLAFHVWLYSDVETMPDQTVTTWYLEMTDSSQLKCKPLAEGSDFEVRESRVHHHEFNRFLYSWVGRSWQWTDKLSWTNQQWRDYAESDQLRLWVGYVKGTPAGFFELHKEGSAVELAYFGLGDGFTDKGLGGYFLSEALSQAWQWGAERVWVHTCTLDHPKALNNYLARGLTVYHKESSPS